MTTTTTTTQILGKFVWRELMTPDVEAAKRFYGQVFGWTFKSGTVEGAPDYTEIGTSHGSFVGGMMALGEGEQAPPNWSGYVSVDDVDAAVARALAAGGKLYVEAMDIPTVGRFAVVADPQGAVTAPFKYLGAEGGDEMPKTGEFCWESLSTTDTAAAKAFYKAVYGWGDQPFGDGTSPVSVLLRPDGNMTASLAPAEPGMPAFWMTYVAVDSLDEINAKVTQAGGKVLAPRVEVPGMGAFTMIQDPQGAVLGAFQGDAPCE